MQTGMLKLHISHCEKNLCGKAPADRVTTHPKNFTVSGRIAEAVAGRGTTTPQLDLMEEETAANEVLA